MKLIRELREEIGRLKAMLLSFELVCGRQDFSVLRRPFSSAEDLSPAAFCALSQVMLEEQRQDGSYCDYLCSFRRDASSLLSKGYLPA